MVLQIAWALWGVGHFVRKLHIDSLYTPQAGLSALVLWVPIWTYGSRILPEMLAYGGYLFTLSALQQLLSHPSLNNGVRLTLWTCLTQAIRPAYLFFWPIPFFAWGAIYLLARRPLRATILCGFMTLTIMLSSLGLQTTIKHLQGSASVSGLGHQLLSVQLYLVDTHTLGTSPSPNEVDEFALHISQQLRERSQLQQVTSQSKSNPHLFEPYFQEMSQLTIRAYANMHQLSSDDNVDLVAFNVLARKLALRIITHNPLRFTRHLAKELFRAERYFAVLVVLLFMLWGLQAAQSRQAFDIYRWLVVTSGLANYAVALMVEPLITRYVYPTDASIIAILFVVRSSSIRNNDKTRTQDIPYEHQ
ncbi:MAG: hypothetical protein KTR25_04100 [Myxococcales bacterium]|nr:hypothetical protein [Myxococcales bacterium]